jgi:hypothetical protein
MNLYALELSERSGIFVEPVEECKERWPLFDDGNEHTNLTGLCHEDIQKSLHVNSWHSLVWYQPRLLVVLDTYIKRRGTGSLEEKLGSCVANLEIREQDGVPQRLVVSGYVAPTPANPGQPESQ